MLVRFLDASMTVVPDIPIAPAISSFIWGVVVPIPTFPPGMRARCWEAAVVIWARPAPVKAMLAPAPERVRALPVADEEIAPDVVTVKADPPTVRLAPVMSSPDVASTFPPKVTWPEVWLRVPESSSVLVVVVVPIERPVENLPRPVVSREKPEVTVVVPIPTLPLLSMRNLVVPDLEAVKTA